MNEKVRKIAVFQKLQPHCGTGYRCPIKMKLLSQLATIMVVSAKILRVVSCDQ